MFIVRMAWREMRWSWRRLLFFFLCLSVGVASIATLRSVVPREAAVLKTLGATTGQVAAMLAMECGLIGAAAGVIGAGGASALSWAVGSYLLGLPWTPEFGTLAAGAALAALLVMLIDVLASLGVLGRKPLSTLRAE